MSYYDYAVVGIYLCFIACIGLIFRKFSKDSSDFFRGGGNILWWMVGATAFMSQFSSWTFTGAASKAYTNGPLVMTIFFGNAIGYFIAYAWSAKKFRQLRVVTPMEGVRDRFGLANEQFFTWIWIPIGIFYAAIWLNAVSAFASVVFQMDLTLTIIVVGSVVLFVASLGGAWGVVASDFMQMVLLVPISIVVAIFSIQAVGDGNFLRGMTSFVSRLPEHHLNWTAVLRPQIIAFWIIAVLIKQFFTTNNLNDSNRFLFAKDSKNASKAALLAAVLFVVGPIVWFIPPMAAAILYPDLTAIPGVNRLSTVTDGAYVAIGIKTMPVGMIGLMISAIFAATMSSMDSGLNKNAGIFIRNFYKPILRKHATEKEYVIAGRLISFTFGILIILAALYIAKKGVGLFDVMMLFSSMVAVPFVMPLMWAIIIKRTPSWTGWSTVCVGLLMSYLTNKYVGMEAVRSGADPEWVRTLFGVDSAIRPTEVADYVFMVSLIANVVVGSLWFLGTTLFAHFNAPAYSKQEDEFFERMNDPVTSDPAETRAMDLAQLRTLSRLCFPYGGFVLLLAAIPNPWSGRVSFFISGGIIIAVAVILRWKANKVAAEVATPPPAEPVKSPAPTPR